MDNATLLTVRTPCSRQGYLTDSSTYYSRQSNYTLRRQYTLYNLKLRNQIKQI